MLRQVPHRFREISDADWTGLLLRSVDERIVEGMEFPTFPPASVQEQFVGVIYQHALLAASPFYTFVKETSTALGMPISHSASTLLDFGCGWGRFLRFFWRDLDSAHLVGVDTDPDILAMCEHTGVQAVLNRVEPLGRLNLPDSSQSHMIAFSVFTHLPENVQHHWLRELSRVARPGCVFACTVQPRGFLEFIARIPDDAPSAWHQGLRRAAGDVGQRLRKFDAGEFVYMPTGGGAYRQAVVYGDAMVPKEYIDREWSNYFTVRQYEADRFGQAAVVLQKT